MTTIHISPSRLVLTITLACSLLIICRGTFGKTDQKEFIFYMGDRPKSEISATAHHMSMLQATLGSKRASESWLYSYKRSFNGFVARLTEEEKDKIANMDGIVSVIPNDKAHLHTTRSWDFIGFPIKVERSKIESDIIIGMLDTGIWPESQSFSDEGFGPPPSKWKGTCHSSSNFTCNNKIIGAKYYRSDGSISAPDVPSPRDTEGHGTHTSSTAAGDPVPGAGLYGLGSGTARGGVPSSRIAVYKVCWSDGCAFADILAAFDDAIADGVDLISLSVGGFFPSDYFGDTIAIGAFHAMKHGVFTSNSAGNNGPEPYTIVNFSPWALSVAASTIDRKFLAEMRLGNDRSYEGVSINTFTLEEDNYPLVTGGGCQGTMDPNLVKGTIVLCDVGGDSETVAAANGTGAILLDDGPMDWGQSYTLPATSLNSSYGAQIYDYINKTSKPTATIFKSTEANQTSAPFVVSFSSRGPNPITADLLKPDLCAPGVEILAAWSQGTTVTGDTEDNRVVPYNIISGTSMACPHATSAAAYVKSFNPDWSPSAIKSALLTTATPMSPSKNADAEFSYGSGQIDPVRAKSPGLVYDASEADYVSFLCGQGYNVTKLRLVTGDNQTCTSSNNATVYDLNYPSFTLSGSSGETVARVFNRKVTNVGSAASSYKCAVSAVPGLDVSVEPSVLSFSSVGEVLSFKVTVRAKIGDGVMSGSLVWDDGTYQVRSPVVAYALQN